MKRLDRYFWPYCWLYLAAAFVLLGHALHPDQTYSAWIGALPWIALRVFLFPGDFLAGLLQGCWYGHNDVPPEIMQLSLRLAVLFNCAFWFFPTGRLMRRLGIFDPFSDSHMPRPRLLRAAVAVADGFNKRLFGRQKTGGWA